MEGREVQGDAFSPNLANVPFKFSGEFAIRITAQHSNLGCFPTPPRDSHFNLLMADFFVSTKVADWFAVDLVAGGWGLLEAGCN